MKKKHTDQSLLKVYHVMPINGEDQNKSAMIRYEIIIIFKSIL